MTVSLDYGGQEISKTEKLAEEVKLLLPNLLSQHSKMLRDESAITDEVIIQRGYRSIADRQELLNLGFADWQVNVPSLLVPIHRPNGTNSIYQHRPDEPRIKKKDGKPVKYESMANSGIYLDCPPVCQSMLSDPSIPLWVTEGCKKGDSLASRGLCVISLIGVDCFDCPEDWRCINLKNRKVYIIFDSDVTIKPQVQGALNRLVKYLKRLGAGEILPLLLPNNGREKLGVDDYLATGATIDDLLNLEVLELGLFEADKLERLVEAAATKEVIDRDNALRGVFTEIAKCDDDFILTRLRSSVAKKLNLKLREYDRLLKVAKNAARPEGTSLTDSNYMIANGRICYRRFTKDGDMIFDPLCNFVASITEDVLHDDGEDIARNFSIIGELASGESLSPITIPASKFGAMNWVSGEWGARAVVGAGMGTKDRLREAIQLLSSDISSRHVFTHTGWREVKGKRVYLSASGATGIDGVSVEMAKEFEHYCLPLKPNNLSEAMKASLRFLDSAPFTVSIPIWAAVWLAPLAEIIYPAFVIWLYGTTGSKKSTIAALALNHYGERFSDTLLPADWWATVNSLEKMIFLAKDALFVIDDYRPESDPFRRRELETAAARIIRHVGNRSGRGRMNADLSLRTTYRPRGLVLATGEQLPSGRSIMGRLFTVEVGEKDVDTAKLTACQGESTQYSHALSGYLRWLADQWQHLETELPKLWNKVRYSYQHEDAHARTAGTLASLYLGLEMGLQYAVEVGALDQGEYTELRQLGETALLTIANDQAKLVVEEKPAIRFLKVVASLLCQKKVALEGLNSKDAGLGGTPGKPDHAERLGWCDKDYVFLIPSASFNKVSRYCASERYHFPVTERTLKKELAEEGYTLTEDTRNTKRVLIEGKQEPILAIQISIINRFSPGELPTWTGYGDDGF